MERDYQMQQLNKTDVSDLSKCRLGMLLKVTCICIPTEIVLVALIYSVCPG